MEQENCLIISNFTDSKFTFGEGSQIRKIWQCQRNILVIDVALRNAPLNCKVGISCLHSPSAACSAHRLVAGAKPQSLPQIQISRQSQT